MSNNTAHVIAVAQRKGGVGKTTLAVCVAGELRRRRKQVALIDADLQESATQWGEPGNLGYPVYTLSLGGQSITDWARKFNDIATTHSYIVVDTAPSERDVVASLAVANLVLLPCTPSGLDIEATARTLDIIYKIRAHRQQLPRLIIVPNRVDARTLEGRQLVDELKTFKEVVGPAVGNRSSFVRAFSTGYAVAAMPEGELARHEIQVLCDLVEKNLQPERKAAKT